MSCIDGTCALNSSSDDIIEFPHFRRYPKIARFSRTIIITEKIDGTNGAIEITREGGFFVASRDNWITPSNDNHGFAKWAYENKEELMQLGVGHHSGEWWGKDIQRNYGLNEKRFSLFNTRRWNKQNVPSICSVVPVLYIGPFSHEAVNDALEDLEINGSKAAPGYMKPEGVIIYHTAGNICFKKTIAGDDEGKKCFQCHVKNDHRMDCSVNPDRQITLR